MRKNMDIITSFIIGLIVTGGIAYAINLSSNSVSYNNKVSGLDSENVQEAIDELDAKVEKVASIKKFCQYKNSNQVIEENRSNHLAPGTLYECTLGKNNNNQDIKEEFYVLAVENDEVRMIMEHNLTADTVGITWMQARDIFNDSTIQNGVGTQAKQQWTNVLDIDLPRAQDIADAVGNTSWRVGSKTTGQWFYLDPYPSNGTYGQVQVADGSNKSNFAWLYNHTRYCSNWGCTSTDSVSMKDSGHNYGYWTRDAVPSLWQSETTPRAWNVIRYSSLHSNYVSDVGYGVRPVIKVVKGNLYE